MLRINDKFQSLNRDRGLSNEKIQFGTYINFTSFNPSIGIGGFQTESPLERL